MNHQNAQGQTGLHYAMTYGFTDLGAWMIEHGANDQIMNMFSLTPYDGLTLD